MRKIDGIRVNPGKRDKGVTLWNIVRKYVEKNHPNVPIDGDNSSAGCWRFRVEVLKNEIVISDAGKSPGMKSPEDFPRKTILAADPDFFKKLSKVLKRGNVCVYRKLGSPYGNKTAWIMMSAPDLLPVHAPDVEKTLVDQMAWEIATEIDKSILNDLINAKPLDVGDIMPPRNKKKKK
jgi:hypothetical protein